MYDSVKDWLDYEQKMEIARECGVTSSRQVSNILSGKSKNFTLLTKLIEKAEENKRLYERARALENTPEELDKFIANSIVKLNRSETSRTDHYPFWLKR